MQSPQGGSDDAQVARGVGSRWNGRRHLQRHLDSGFTSVKKEATFAWCRDKKLLPFDFLVRLRRESPSGGTHAAFDLVEADVIIEMDGEQ